MAPKDPDTRVHPGHYITDGISLWWVLQPPVQCLTGRKQRVKEWVLPVENCMSGEAERLALEEVKSPGIREVIPLGSEAPLPEEALVS